MTDKDTRLGTGYDLPNELGMVRGVHRQPRLAGGAIVTENGTLASDDFSAGVAGWQISGNGNAEFNNGTFRGTVTSGSTITGGITVQSGGSMSSANYVADTSGWKIDGTGTAEFNSVKVRGSITSGGALQSSNFSADSAGWKVDGAGTAEFNSVKVRGTITSGGTLASANFSTGSTGWSIAGSGAAEFNNVTVRGAIVASSFTTDTTGATSWVQFGAAPGGSGNSAIYMYRSSIPVAVLYGVTGGGTVLSATNSSAVGQPPFLNLDASSGATLEGAQAFVVATAGDLSLDSTGGHVVVNGKFGGTTTTQFDNEPEVLGSGNGVLVHSVNGSRWRIAVTNAGTLSIASA